MSGTCEAMRILQYLPRLRWRLLRRLHLLLQKCIGSGPLMLQNSRLGLLALLRLLAWHLGLDRVTRQLGVHRRLPHAGRGLRRVLLRALQNLGRVLAGHARKWRLAERYVLLVLEMRLRWRKRLLILARHGRGMSRRVLRGRGCRSLPQRLRAHHGLDLVQTHHLLCRGRSGLLLLLRRRLLSRRLRRQTPDIGARLELGDVVRVIVVLVTRPGWLGRMARKGRLGFALVAGLE